jgi:hypothetical protein
MERRHEPPAIPEDHNEPTPTLAAVEPAVLVDLNSRAERERLSKAALKGFFKLAAAWKLRDEDARELLGGLSSSQLLRLEKKPDRVLEVDRITRISYLLGIYKALHILYGDKLADEWVHLPNSNHLRRPHAAGATCWPAACWPCRRCASCSTRAAEACDLGRSFPN